jgi:Leucine-rich repeat (LRR) protein
MRSLTWLTIATNNLTCLPAEFSNLVNLKTLSLHHNKFQVFPREILALTNLETLALSNNQIRSIPDEIINLRDLTNIQIEQNGLQWVPMTFAFKDNLRSFQRAGNNLIPNFEDIRDIVLNTTHVGMIRQRLTAIAVGLQDLQLPALVLLEICDASVPPSRITMKSKWDVICAVKHFKDKR